MGCFGSDEQTQEQKINFTPEAEQAQKSWFDTISEWGKSGDYGATDMNWDDIFKSAEKKINQYYWGGVGTTGLAGKVKASAARRNASQSPALEKNLGLMGMQQSSDLSDLITNLTTQKASYQEGARKTWLQSLMGLAGLSEGQTTIASGGDGMGEALSAVIGAGTSFGLGKLFPDETDED